eukprot:m.378754 g.378754  ORF g.378754 m.378754 type:complete len:55 (-) comp56204_c0_seq1:186-350(-)
MSAPQSEAAASRSLSACSLLVVSYMCRVRLYSRSGSVLVGWFVCSSVCCALFPA